jgi:hypothetical protein
MTQWEYCWLNIGHIWGGHQKAMNDLGEDGWELVSVFGFESCPYAYFKRPKHDA